MLPDRMKVRVVTGEMLNAGWMLKWGDRLVRRPYIVVDNLPDGNFLVEEPMTEAEEFQSLPAVGR